MLWRFLLFLRTLITFHQLAICIANKTFLIIAELLKLFIIKLLVDSYVIHSKNFPLNFLLLTHSSISLLQLYYHPSGTFCIVSSDDTCVIRAPRLHLRIFYFFNALLYYLASQRDGSFVSAKNTRKADILCNAGVLSLIYSVLKKSKEPSL